MNEVLLTTESQNPHNCKDKYLMLQHTENILGLVKENADIISKTLDLAGQITDVYAESQRLNAQVAIASEMSKVELAKIASKYMVTRDLIEKTFAERGCALSYLYATLDHALERGDNELILASMNKIGAIVTSSPLADIQEFTRKFNDTNVPLLDF